MAEIFLIFLEIFRKSIQERMNHAQRTKRDYCREQQAMKISQDPWPVL